MCVLFRKKQFSTERWATMTKPCAFWCTRYKTSRRLKDTATRYLPINQFHSNDPYFTTSSKCTRIPVKSKSDNVNILKLIYNPRKCVSSCMNWSHLSFVSLARRHGKSWESLVWNFSTDEEETWRLLKWFPWFLLIGLWPASNQGLETWW